MPDTLTPTERAAFRIMGDWAEGRFSNREAAAKALVRAVTAAHLDTLTEEAKAIAAQPVNDEYDHGVNYAARHFLAILGSPTMPDTLTGCAAHPGLDAPGCHACWMANHHNPDWLIEGSPTHD